MCRFSSCLLSPPLLPSLPSPLPPYRKHSSHPITLPTSSCVLWYPSLLLLAPVAPPRCEKRGRAAARETLSSPAAVRFLFVPRESFAVGAGANPDRVEEVEVEGKMEEETEVAVAEVDAKEEAIDDADEEELAGYATAPARRSSRKDALGPR